MSDYDNIPDELVAKRQWMLWDGNNDSPRRPAGWNEATQRLDWAASWKEPTDWLTFDEAVEAAQTAESYGIGYVFRGDEDYIPIDVDGCYDAQGQLKEWVPDLERFEGATYMEFSPSGDGLHIYVKHPQLPPWWTNQHFTDEEHEGLEAYDNKFFTVTGNQHPESLDTIDAVNPDGFLWNGYTAISGDSPVLDTSDGSGRSGGSGTSEDIDVDVYDVLSRSDFPEGERCSHPVHPSGTGSNFHVDNGGETFRCWRHKITGNGLHLLGMQESIIDCGDWRNGLSDGKWEQIFDAAREKGLDVPDKQAPATADGGVATETAHGSPGSETDADESPKWKRVGELFASETNGTTTEGYSMAADILCEKYDFVAIRESGEMYHYNNDVGYYVRKGETFVRELLDDHIPKHVNGSRVRNISETVRSRNYIERASDFTPPEGKVNVRNGVLDLKTRTLEPHSPEYHFTARLDVDYDPDVTGGIWVEQLERALDSPGERKKLEEFIGYCLEQWHHDREKNMFFVGPRASGKSSVQEAIQSLFGDPPTVSNLTPQQIADTTFDAAALYDATLNTVNDINASKIEDTGTLKRIWSGERTKLENKNKDRFFAAPTAKHLYTANWFPRMVGQDESIYRRMLIIEFENAIPEGERDRTVKKAMKTERARQVILNRALDARDRLHEQGGFTNDRSDEETRKTWDSWRDSHKRFLYTQFEVTGDSEQTVGKGAYYRAFKEYVGRTGYSMKSKQSITKSLQWVPEVDVFEETYGGIEWREQDAAAPDDDEEPTAKQAVTEVAKSAGTEIHRTHVKAQLGDRFDIEPENAEVAIEKAVRDGRVMEKDGGYLTPVN